MIRAYDGYGGRFTAETEYESSPNHEIEKIVRLVADELHNHLVAARCACVVRGLHRRTRCSDRIEKGTA